MAAECQKWSVGVWRQGLFIPGFRTRRDLLIVHREKIRVVAGALTIYRNKLELSSIKTTWNLWLGLRFWGAVIRPKEQAGAYPSLKASPFGLMTLISPPEQAFRRIRPRAGTHCPKESLQRDLCPVSP